MLDGNAEYQTLKAEVARLAKQQRSANQDRSGPLKIAERTFRKRLGVNPSGTDLVHELHGEYKRFEAWVGVDALEKQKHYFVKYKVLVEK